MKQGLLVLTTLLSSVVHSETRCIAHKGYHAAVPENSLESIATAMELGADGIEFDVNHTAEGEAIVMHDKLLQKTVESRPGKSCPLKTPIRELTLGTIREHCQLKGSGAPVPTLQEALEVLEPFAGHVFVELKDRPDQKTKRMLEVHFQQNVERLLVISFDVKRMAPWRMSSEFWSLVKFQDLALLPFEVDRNYGLNLNYKSYKLRKKFLRRVPIEVGVHTVNLPANISYFMQEGVDFVTTDNLPECLALKH